MISKNEIKFLKSLNFLKFRDKHSMFKVEGWRSLKEFLKSDYKLVSIFAESNWLTSHNVSLKNVNIIQQRDLRSISSLKNPNQIIGVFEKQKYQVEIDSFRKEIGVFLEDVTNPGNLGSIIRTCDWFGIKKIICSNDSVDVYNPKVVQSSMGSLSRVSIQYVNRDVFLLHSDIRRLLTEFKKKRIKLETRRKRLRAGTLGVLTIVSKEFF
mgnify:CR=1 FL=1